jgi:hypothetical protein
MKKNLFAFALLTIGTGVFAQTRSLIVKEKNGTEHVYATTNVRKLAFSSGNLVVTPKSGTADSYTLSAFQQLRFDQTVTAFGAEEPTDIKRFALYPNPVLDILHLQLLGTATQVQILDMEGKVWINKIVEGNEATFGVVQLPIGVYACTLKDGNSSKIMKFLKQ